MIVQTWSDPDLMLQDPLYQYIPSLTKGRPFTTILYVSKGGGNDNAFTIRIAQDTVTNADGSTTQRVPTLNVIEHINLEPPGELAPGQQTHSTTYKLYDLGQIKAVDWPNKKFYDPDTGQGLVADRWGYISRNCKQFCDQLEFGKFVAGAADDNILALSIIDEIDKAQAWVGSDTAVAVAQSNYDRFYRMCDRSAQFWNQMYVHNPIMTFRTPIFMNIARRYVMGGSMPT